jgi:hypothetical protein
MLSIFSQDMSHSSCTHPGGEGAAASEVEAGIVVVDRDEVVVLGLAVGFGRIVASETEAPNMLINLV